jgi:ABC-type multidrug transport system ATPase subunit
VDAFPDNVHSRVGARGLALSGGQRQRVAIARAMVRQPYMLILDEATSALDPTNEKVVQAALDELVQTSGATSLTIAHRLTTVKDCDKIMVFSDGRLVEEGTHASLLEIPVEKSAPRGKQPGSVTKGFYASQWRSMMGEKPGASSPDSASTAPSSAPSSGSGSEEAARRPSLQELEWQEQVVRSRQDVEAAQRLASTVAKDYARDDKELDAARLAAAPVLAPAAPPPLATITRATSAPHKLAPPHARPCA